MHSSVHRIWRAFGTQPHRSETHKLSNDPLFAENVRDSVGLYMSPSKCALVLCVDKKSQIQARAYPALPPRRPGQVERFTQNNTLHSTTTLFAVLDVSISAVIGRC
jgi:hypothetical protein